MACCHQLLVSHLQWKHSWPCLPSRRHSCDRYSFSYFCIFIFIGIHSWSFFSFVLWQGLLFEREMVSLSFVLFGFIVSILFFLYQVGSMSLVYDWNYFGLKGFRFSNIEVGIIFFLEDKNDMKSYFSNLLSLWELFSLCNKESSWLLFAHFFA